MLHVAPKRKLPFLAFLSLIIIALLGQKFALSLQYDRASVLNGEYWRIITCHFTHVGLNHLLLNMVGTILVFSLFFRLYSPLCWLIGASCCIVSIGLSFLLFSPNLEWYMGLSGLLHGLLMMGIIGEIRKGNMIYCIGLLAIVGKIAMEQIVGPSNYTNLFINAFVITSAHLSGAIAGGIIACVIIYLKEIVPNQSINLNARPAA